MRDTVYREDAIDAIRASTKKYTGFMEMEQYTDDDAVEAIEGLPSAHPYDYSDGYADGYKQGRKDAQQERTGKWIKNDNGTWSCDQCNSWIPDEQHHYARFCLYCGAKMEDSE